MYRWLNLRFSDLLVCHRGVVGACRSYLATMRRVISCDVLRRIGRGAFPILHPPYCAVPGIGVSQLGCVCFSGRGGEFIVTWSWQYLPILPLRPFLGANLLNSHNHIHLGSVICSPLFCSWNSQLLQLRSGQTVKSHTLLPPPTTILHLCWSNYCAPVPHPPDNSDKVWTIHIRWHVLYQKQFHGYLIFLVNLVCIC